MEKIVAKIDSEIDAFALLMKNKIKMKWKIKCQDMFNVPLPLYRRGRRRVRPDE